MYSVLVRFDRYQGSVVVTPQPKKKTPAKTAESVKIPIRAYRTLQRLAKAEQRTLGVTAERAIEHYRATLEGGTAR